jgi:hypothetical protein
MRILPQVHRPPQIEPKPIILRPSQNVVSLDAYRAFRDGDRPTPPGVALVPVEIAA